MLGGLLVFALVGFWMMGRVDRFLNAARAEQDGAAACRVLEDRGIGPLCDAAWFLKLCRRLRSSTRTCGVSCPSEEKRRFWDVSAQAMWTLRFSPVRQGAERRFESRDFLFSPVSFRAVEDCTTLSSIDTSVRRQRILLKQNTSASLAAEFVQRICEQKP